MTERLARQLGLPTKRSPIAIGGLNQIRTQAHRAITASIESRDSKYQKTLSFLTIPIITDCMPAETIDRSRLKLPKNLKLADPEFYKPAPVDMLLGAGPTLSLFCNSQYDLSTRNGLDLIMKKTRLGWILGGSLHDETTDPKHHTFVMNTEFDLSKFWEIEEGPREVQYSLEEQAAENHFQQHYTRDSTGRCVVALPFKSDPRLLGESRRNALKRFYALERKLERDDNLKKQYQAVIEEYLTLGHMSRASDIETPGFYLPHHAVIKESSLTTKLRVVFDGSAPTTSGVSLNETLMVGPTIQDDIFSLILRFRSHTYVLTGDIEKMYRQFLVREEDRRYQRILWRNEISGEISTYELNTVTFGLSAAPFLAIRCLQQLARDHANQYPLAAKILQRDVYVDDLLTGFDSLQEASMARDQITRLLKQGGLDLRQWASNAPQLLKDLAPERINQRLLLNDDKTIKTLGISWNSNPDTITYTARKISPREAVTKRTILSEVATIFDPLGLLGPVILKAKSIIQKLWSSKVDWDESIPSNIHTSWIEFCTQLPKINQLQFRRQILIDNARHNQIHGFCDASETGYGACIYIRSTDDLGRCKVNLLCSRSRVAPLKTISIPRLELCGAHTLVKLYNSVKQAMHTQIEKTVLWTDSTIALVWVNTEPHTLKTFVSNRVSEIQRGTQGCQWRHVRSEDNPADALSRGQHPNEFAKNDLWHHGPTWLVEPENIWPQPPTPAVTADLEKRSATCLTAFPEGIALTNFSTLTRLVRVFTYCFRFIKGLQGGTSGCRSSTPITRTTATRGMPKPIEADEFNNTLMRIVRQVQQRAFYKEIESLQKGATSKLHASSKITALNPFIDDQGLLRVGGRLQKSLLAFAQKHPIIMPQNNHLTDLIIQHEHRSHLHAGIQATLYAVRHSYWPLDGRNQVRKNVRKCIRCCRARPPTTTYIMGNLPQARISGGIRPFMNVGVDYCGPFLIKEKKYRNRGKIKVYVAVFVCLAVKAVHLELVSDMTSAGFIAALDRFIARRGKPTKMHSDNGTNFTGANNELRGIITEYQTSQAMEIKTHLSTQGIQWQFTPPLSPHFGGIWEAAVKSFKHHLIRVVGNELFTFEEFNTLITKIEAVLNSRPITPMSTDPNDLQALTPGHFLIGTALTALPEEDLSKEKSNTLSRWQLVQKVRQDFWNRWHKEYLNELNIRKRWTTGNHDIQVGSIVLLKEDNLPPMQWRLGRVITIHPGDDGITRVVSVKTTTGILKRNVKKLAPLPIPNTSVERNEEKNAPLQDSSSS